MQWRGQRSGVSHTGRKNKNKLIELIGSDSVGANDDRIETGA